MKLWPKIKNEEWLEDILLESRSVRYWADIFQQTYENKIDTWGYCWTFSCWIQNGLTIIPNVNLVSNVGFGVDSTHTKGKSKFFDMTREAMSFPLQHPPFMIRNTETDDFVQKTHFYKPNIFLRLAKKVLLVGRKLISKFTLKNRKNKN